MARKGTRRNALETAKATVTVAQPAEAPGAPGPAPGAKAAAPGRPSHKLHRRATGVVYSTPYGSEPREIDPAA
jgi:hypothetical protein